MSTNVQMCDVVAHTYRTLWFWSMQRLSLYSGFMAE